MGEQPAAVRFRFPLGQYVAARATTAWPPDPWRVLAAMVDVACSDPTFGSGDTNTPARRLLMRLASAPAPLIDVPCHMIAPEVFHWVPRSVATATSRKWDDRVAGPRRTFVSVSPEDTLRYVWPDVPVDSDDLRLLHELVSRIPHLGQSEAVVHADADSSGMLPLANPGSQLAPIPQGSYPLRWIDGRAVAHLFVDDPDDPEWGFGGARRQFMATTVLYGPARVSGRPCIVVPAEGARPGPRPNANAVAVRHVGMAHGDGRILGWLVFTGPPAGWIEPTGAVPRTLQLLRWQRPAQSWVSTEQLPVPAKPSVGGLAAARRVGNDSIAGALAWTYLQDPVDDRALHLPPDAAVTRMTLHRNGQVAGAHGARTGRTHLEVGFDRPVSGPIVINGVLFTQHHDRGRQHG